MNIINVNGETIQLIRAIRVGYRAAAAATAPGATAAEVEALRALCAQIEVESADARLRAKLMHDRELQLDVLSVGAAYVRGNTWREVRAA